MKKLQALYTKNANKIIEQATKEKSAIKNLNFLIDLVMVFSNIEPALDKPQTLNEAWNHPNKKSWRKWQEAIWKEFANMNKQQVWQKMLKSLMLSNCRYIKNDWVFKIKHNSMYQACLAACGYSQVPGIDFSKSYSQVVKNITFCILLLKMIHFG